MESVLERHGPCKSFELSIVRIGFETAEIRGNNETQITVVGGRRSPSGAARTTSWSSARATSATTSSRSSSCAPRPTRPATPPPAPTLPLSLSLSIAHPCALSLSISRSLSIDQLLSLSLWGGCETTGAAAARRAQEHHAGGRPGRRTRGRSVREERGQTRSLYLRRFRDRRVYGGVAFGRRGKSREYGNERERESHKAAC